MSMRKFLRGEEPPVLAKHGKEWGREWEPRCKGGGFYWHEHGNRKVNHILLDGLKKQTQNHCSFCDAYPVAPPGQDNIEHFRPKSQYPLEAFAWDNLYYCCNFCQGQKREKFDEKLLRPDAPGYRFDDYFRWDYTSGDLHPNPGAPLENRERARITIEMYGLNTAHPQSRCDERDKVAAMSNSAIQQDKHPYRNFLFQTESPNPPNV